LIAHYKPLSIWRITDGKAGHDAQSLGLVAALAGLTSSQTHEIKVPPVSETLSGLLARKFSAGDRLPNPDLIIGAGHQTHLPMLCAKRARAGRTIVLMRPSLPVAWFDLCFIPRHDLPPRRANVQTTRGALNNIVPSTKKDAGKGLILIGGPSRHFHWKETGLILQVLRILEDTTVHWSITDSARTPDSTRQLLKTLRNNNLTYTPSAETGQGWVAAQLAVASRTWVSVDSVSMVYEALTSGTAVGLLNVPIKKSNRIADAARQLAEEGLVTRFEDWAGGRKLETPRPVFNEASRCAQQVLQYFSLPMIGPGAG